VARARLARAQAERAEWGNAHMRAELHPTAEIPELRARAQAAIWELIAALPDAVLRQAPHLANDLGALRLALEQIAAIVQSEPRSEAWNTTPKPKKHA
jgi:phage terminase Nu1 subunit (DNA packaging protein)